MSDDPFKYDDQTWRKLEAIVLRAGSDAAKEKFTAMRANFEMRAGGWKTRIARWDGHTLGRDDDTEKYKRIGRAALELIAALDDLNFPASFVGHELVWKGPDESDVNDDERFSSFCDANSKRFSRFRGAVEHVGFRAKRRAAKNPKRKNFARDCFFAELTRIWRDDLGLNVGVSANSLLVAFIEMAASGACDLKKEKAKDTISIHSGSGRCKNRLQNILVFTLIGGDIHGY